MNIDGGLGGRFSADAASFMKLEKFRSCLNLPMSMSRFPPHFGETQQRTDCKMVPSYVAIVGTYTICFGIREINSTLIVPKYQRIVDYSKVGYLYIA